VTDVARDCPHAIVRSDSGSVFQGTRTGGTDGRLPALKDGTLGDLTVPAEAFEDPNVAIRLSAESKEPFLNAETLLIAHINPQSAPIALLAKVAPSASGFLGTGVEFLLKEEQQVLNRGTKNSVLLHCRCYIPSLETEAKSINHAYSLISQAYEPHRISHTGNVFSKVFYKDGPVWKPLEALRGY
jgi:hypothetical protein